MRLRSPWRAALQYTTAILAATLTAISRQEQYADRRDNGGDYRRDYLSKLVFSRHSSRSSSNLGHLFTGTGFEVGNLGPQRSRWT
jgi:hypothetical protein